MPIQRSIDAGFVKDLQLIKSQLTGMQSLAQTARLDLLVHLVDMAMMEASELLEESKHAKPERVVDTSL